MAHFEVGKDVVCRDMLKTKEIFANCYVRRKYKLFFVNSDGLYLILDTWSSQKIVKMVKILNKVENNLIIK